tara:strand:+ start:334 stop:846 length:513 start_codon:yes stop_codon:yes gene_type:complete
MPGSLVKVSEVDVSSAQATVTLTGIDDTYNVYKLMVTDVTPDTDSVNLMGRITKSGSPDTTSNYDVGYLNMNSYANASATDDVDQDSINFGNTGSGTGETQNLELWLFNFHTATYSNISREQVAYNASPALSGQHGQITHTVSTASDGMHFYFASGNIVDGKFSLYGISK